MAYQYNGEIFYRSYKLIPAGTELLMWYGDDYAHDLGIDRHFTLTAIYIEGEGMFYQISLVP